MMKSSSRSFIAACILLISIFCLQNNLQGVPATRILCNSNFMYEKMYVCENTPGHQDTRIFHF